MVKHRFLHYNFKAQQDNMELLDACLEKNVRLVDYERMCDESGNNIFQGKLENDRPLKFMLRVNN